MQKDTALLKVEGLTKYYRGLAANENIDLQITEGQIVGLSARTALENRRCLR